MSDQIDLHDYELLRKTQQMVCQNFRNMLKNNHQ